MASDGRAGIDVTLVRRLVAVQFTQWADLEVSLPTGAAVVDLVLDEAGEARGRYDDVVPASQQN